MANGKITLGKQSGGQLALVFPDGVANTEVVLPESGVLATKQYVDDADALKVALADFTGTNVSLNSNGYQKLPSGLIIQWGISNVTSENVDVFFPISFPHLVLHINEHDSTSSAGTTRTIWQFRNIGKSGFNALNIGTVTKNITTVGGALLSGCVWFAIGY